MEKFAAEVEATLPQDPAKLESMVNEKVKALLASLGPMAAKVGPSGQAQVELLKAKAKELLNALLQNNSNRSVIPL